MKASLCPQFVSVCLVAGYRGCTLGSWLITDCLHPHWHSSSSLSRWITSWTLELQTKLREDFTITEKAPTRACRCFQPGEGPGRGLLYDCKIFANLRLQRYWTQTEIFSNTEMRSTHIAHLLGLCSLWPDSCHPAALQWKLVCAALPLQAPPDDDLQVTLHPTPGHGGTKYPHTHTVHCIIRPGSCHETCGDTTSTRPGPGPGHRRDQNFPGAYPCCRDLGWQNVTDFRL